ncbi:hypothetical protein, partial [Dictyobacter arantiisoli]|uniref:hypothetical protein n=1 Tax=Dictyobacter arantiisoli TaxID=2014874 RepID=UPI001C0EB7B8
MYQHALVNGNVAATLQSNVLSLFFGLARSMLSTISVYEFSHLRCSKQFFSMWCRKGALHLSCTT